LLLEDPDADQVGSCCARAETLHAKVVDNTVPLDLFNSLSYLICIFGLQESQNQPELVTIETTDSYGIVLHLFQSINPNLSVFVCIFIKSFKTVDVSVPYGDHLGCDTSLIFQTCSGEYFLTDTCDFMNLEDGAHGVNVGLEQLKMDIFVTGEGVGFLELMVEFKTDLIVVKSVTFNVLQSFSDKSVDLQAFSLFLWHLIHDELPSVQLLPTLKLLVKRFQLFGSILT